MAGAGADLAARSGMFGLSGTLLVAATSAGMLVSGRLQSPQSRIMVALAPLFGLWLFVRMSPWLLPLDLLAAGGLLFLGASLARGGSILDLSVPGLVWRGVWGALHGVAGLAFAIPPLARVRERIAASSEASGRTRATVRGLLMAAPLLAVLGFLLASADAVFASFFRIPIEVDPVAAFGHALVVALGAWGMLGLLRLASAQPHPLAAPGRRSVGSVEATVVLATLDALFAAFAAAQLVAVSSGGRRVIETAGLTYAEYARTGFFQLLAVAAITLTALMALWGLADRETPSVRCRLRVLAEIAVALTLVVVFVAVRRMDLYEQMFGLTMLRLYVKVACFWIAGVFVLFGVYLAGVAAPRAWFVPAAAALGLTAVFALNVANPEAVVVRNNVGHARAGHPFDPSYLMELSDDAVPTVLKALPDLSPADRTAVHSTLCATDRETPFKGWAALNLSRERAAGSLAAECDPR